MAIQNENDIFAHFGLDQTGKAIQPSNGPSAAELNQRLAALEAENQRLTSERQTYLTQKPAAPQAWAPQPLPELDLSTLPDAFADPAAYSKALAAAVSEHNRKTIQITRDNDRGEAAQHANQSGRVENLWKGFEKAHPDLAAQRDLIEFAANKVAADAAAKGIDVERYLFATPDAFYGDVVKYAQTINPTIGKAADPAPVADDFGIFSGGPGLPEGRTGGIAGGEESNFRPSAAQQDQPGDMLADLKKLQKASGFY